MCCIALVIALAVIVYIETSTVRVTVPTSQAAQDQSIHSATVAEAPVDTQVNTRAITTEEHTNVFITPKDFAIRIIDVNENSILPVRYTCDGIGEAPRILIFNAPKRTTSFALIMHDSDVPIDIRADNTWYHWTAWNIPSTATEVSAFESAPVQYGLTTSRITGYVPPCPPDDEHRYTFTLYALDVALELNEGAGSAELMSAMDGHILKTAVLTTTYNRHEKTITDTD